MPTQAIKLTSDELGIYHAAHQRVVITDLSSRGRICLIGEDRARFLHGQVTNDIKGLSTWSACYAAVVNHKGKFESDAHILNLENEILIDFEEGLTERVSQRLDSFIIADDVEIVDVAPHYGMLHIAGPQSASVLQKQFPDWKYNADTTAIQKLGGGDDAVYIYRHARFGIDGFDLFLPVASISDVLKQLTDLVQAAEGAIATEPVLEALRIEAGIPRYGKDMDISNLAPEAGIESRAISYAKGCYTGQEVIARIRTYGRVAKALRGMVIDGSELPAPGTEIFNGEKKVGKLTSVLDSPALKRPIAFGYVRKECNDLGQALQLKSDSSETTATIVALPFVTEGE